MRLSHEVIKDLLPLYLAGEASPDTCELIERLASEDAEVARLVTIARAGEQALAGSVTARPPESARVALAATRRVLRRRALALPAGLFFTFLPGSFLIDGNDLVWLLWRDNRLLALASWLVAAFCWVVFVRSAWRSREAGL